MPGVKTLLFIYNSTRGVLPSLKDFSAGKAAPSGTDVCNLSAITHSPVGVKKAWKRFLKDLEIPSRSLDRDEFLSEFGFVHPQITFPVVLVQKGTEMFVLIDTEELNRCRDLDDLIHLVQSRLKQV